MTRFLVLGLVVLLAGAPMRLTAENWKLATGNWELPPPTLHRYESVEPHMGTLVKITVYASGEDEARRAFRTGFDRIGQLDAILSDYKPDSELTRIPTMAVGKAVPVSRDLCTVLSVSQGLAAATGGAFDVTQGPVIRVWRNARRSKRLPDSAALRAAAARAGFRKLHVDSERCTATMDVDGMALDVGGIAKGYAAGEALEAIGRAGVRSAMVAVSGDLAFSDAPPGTKGWRVALPDVPGDGDHLPSMLALTHAAVSTAGAAEQHLDAGGQRYSHIIDPRLRMGLTDDLTVTVIARTGLVADGLDTAISVLGVERGLAFADARDDAVAVIARTTAAGTSVFKSRRFEAFTSARHSSAFHQILFTTGR